MAETRMICTVFTFTLEITLKIRKNQFEKGTFNHRNNNEDGDKFEQIQNRRRASQK